MDRANPRCSKDCYYCFNYYYRACFDDEYEDYTELTEDLARFALQPSLVFLVEEDRLDKFKEIYGKLQKRK